MQVFVAADHNGYELKGHLIEVLKSKGYSVVDCGDRQFNPDDDFPAFASQAVTSMLGSSDPEARAVLVCGSGQGMAMAANRFKGIRASVVWDEEEARITRNDNDSNVLCLPARILNTSQAESITYKWLSSRFAGAPRYVRRNQQLDALPHDL